MFNKENISWFKIVSSILSVALLFLAFIAMIMFTAEVNAVVIQADGSTKVSQILDYGDAFWCTIVSATSIGYGDYAPITFLGKLMGISAYIVVGVAMLTAVGTIIGVHLMQKIGVMPTETSNDELKILLERNYEMAQLERDRDEEIIKELKKLTTKPTSTTKRRGSQ